MSTEQPAPESFKTQWQGCPPKKSIDPKWFPADVIIPPVAPEQPNNTEPVVDDFMSNDSFLRIVTVSDTHLKHRQLSNVPKGDLLVHTGDIFFRSRNITDEKEFLAQFDDFNDWLGSLKGNYRYGIVVIAGNHDEWLEKMGAEAVKKRMSNARYLCNEGFTLCGITFFASPHSSGISVNDSFQKGYGTLTEIMPSAAAATDVFLTHQPCSEADLVAVLKEGRCRLHLSGHDHDLAGVYEVAFGGDDEVRERRRKASADAARRRLATAAPQADAAAQLLEKYELPPQARIRYELSPSARPVRRLTGDPANTVSVVTSLVTCEYHVTYSPWVVELPFDVAQGHFWHKGADVEDGAEAA